MKRMIIAGLAVLLIQINVSAQTTRYTLQQCIDTALANNIQVKQTGLLKDAAKVDLQQSKANVFPDLNATLDHGINQGRSIDPYTNSYVNQSVNYAGYGASSGITVFSGRSLQNNIKQNNYSYKAAGMELQQERDNLTLAVILAYLTALNNEDLLSSAEKQRELSLKQLERLQVLDSQGAVNPSEVSDLKGQVMNDELSMLNMSNQMETSKLLLAQLMNVPYNKAMSLERIDAGEFLEAYAKQPAEIFETALKQFSLIKAVAFRTQSSKYALKSTKGTLYPTLFLNGYLQTNYSSAAQNSAGKISYGDQVENNINSTVNLGLRIPVFNYFRARNNVKLASIAVKSSELTEENTKIRLRQDIERAHLNMTNAYQSYKTLVQQVAAYNSSFNAAEIRFQAGVINSVDYLIAKNNLDKANINLISAKYDFVLRKKILDFYQNETK